MYTIKLCAWIVLLTSTGNSLILLGQKEVAQVHFEQGMQSFKGHYLVDASVHFTNAIGEKENYAEAYYYRGECFSRMNQKESAIEDYESSLQHNSTLLLSKIRLIKLYKEFSMHKEGTLLASQLIRLHPENIGAGLYERAYFYEQSGNTPMAIQDYKAFLQLEDEELKSLRKEVAEKLNRLQSGN